MFGRVFNVSSSCPVIYRPPAKKTLSTRLSSKSEDNPRWTRLRDQLISFSHNAYEYDLILKFFLCNLLLLFNVSLSYFSTKEHLQNDLSEV